MERIKNKRPARRAQSMKIVNEVKEILQSGQFGLSALRVLQSRLKATRSELNVLNAELEAVMTDEQVIEDNDSVMEYDEAAVCTLALLEHNTDMLKTSSSLPTTEPPTAADGNRPTEPSTITTRSQCEFGARLPKLELLHLSTCLTWRCLLRGRSISQCLFILKSCRSCREKSKNVCICAVRLRFYDCHP